MTEIVRSVMVTPWWLAEKCLCGDDVMNDFQRED